MLLIVGSNGFLGRHIESHLASMGEHSLGASHQPGTDVHLDLRRPVTKLRLPSAITHAIVCSSVTNIDACYRDPESTRSFNVTNTITLLKSLMEMGIVPIFTSSDLVFEGDSGSYREDDPRCPTTEYGRQKREVEDFVLGRTGPYLIVRMSKLYSVEPDDPSPVGQMLSSLVQSEPIDCASDQVISPTDVKDVAEALCRLVKAGCKGTYHLSSPERYTRYTLGMSIAQRLETTHLVRRCSIRDFAFAEARPTDNSLDVSKFLAEDNFRFTSLEINLQTILSKRRLSRPVGRPCEVET